MPRPTPRVLLVGAYERDNFGDLLYLLQTEHYFAGTDLVAAAPFASDMRELLDRGIPAYGPLLDDEHFDLVWTVGGEVGATKLNTAFHMSAPEQYAEYLAADAAGKGALLDRLAGRIRIESPYMPKLSDYSGRPTPAAVLHSVGIAGIERQDEARKAALLEIVASAAAITVRDRASSDLLRRNRISHVLAPDLVHTIRLTRPRTRPADPQDVLVQISERHLQHHGLEQFAHALATGPHLREERLRLFVAGAAPGHDSVAAYEKLMRHVRIINPDVDIAILAERRPWDRVDIIQRAKLWIGLSLHGRIVAASYDVPRVSLTKPKLNAYARTWDRHMPFGVRAHNLDAAVEKALSAEAQERSRDVGAELARFSQLRIETVRSQLLGSNAAPRNAERRRRRDAHRVNRSVAEGSPLHGVASRSELARWLAGNEVIAGTGLYKRLRATVRRQRAKRSAGG